MQPVITKMYECHSELKCFRRLFDFCDLLLQAAQVKCVKPILAQKRINPTYMMYPTSSAFLCKSGRN